jgi:predicted DNA-binding antitoxin AbrB/MazE fold protein
MRRSIEAVYDGRIFRPIEPADLPPDTRVRLTIEEIGPRRKPRKSFLETAESLRLEGPPDWSENFDRHLHQRRFEHDD